MEAWIWTSLLAWSGGVSSQFISGSPFPSTIPSPVDPKVTVSFREPSAGTCQTEFHTQKQMSGYITLPPGTIEPIQQGHAINTFFWFVEARENSLTAPFTIFMTGGPGSSTMIGMFQEVGPCEAISFSNGSYGTQPRLYGWDRTSNIVFIDQPVQTGFSYDSATNLTYNFYNDAYSAPDALPQADMPSFLSSKGTFSSQSLTFTANTTEIAARSVWHFLQAFLSVFPQYDPGVNSSGSSSGPTGINLFTESYGGIFGPVFAQYFETQNQLRKSDPKSTSLIEIRLESLGIINGMIDQAIQIPFYPKFAYNNSYGIQAINTVTMINALSNFTVTDGCQSKIEQCRSLRNALDPNGYGDVEMVNQYCSTASIACLPIQNAYLEAGLSLYDIRQSTPSPFPSHSYAEYLNYEVIQKSIGAYVNYTDSSNAVSRAFINTGDILQGNPLQDIALLLSQGVRVALIYGDADYICNWQGGEAAANAIAEAGEAFAKGFAAAGYAEIVVNSSYIGGAVKQYGNFSFSRIYDAGHQVPAYQPETAFTLFSRIIFGTSVATGQVIDLDSFSTTGPSNSAHQNHAGPSLNPVCWIRSPEDTCTIDQLKSMLLNQGVVKGGVWYQQNASSPSSVVGMPGGSLPTSASVSTQGSSSVVPTGVYTATSTPSPTSAANPLKMTIASWTLACSILLSRLVA